MNAIGKNVLFELDMNGLIEKNYQGAIVLNDEPNSKIAYVNDAAWKMLGFQSQKQFLNISKEELLNMVCVEDRTKVKQSLTEIFTHPYDPHLMEYSVNRRDGSLCWIRQMTMIQKSKDGKKFFFIGLADNTQHHLLGEERKAFVSNITGGVIIFSSNGSREKVLFSSSGISEMTGYENDEYIALMQEDSLFCVHPEDKARVKSAFQEIKAKRDPDLVTEMIYRRVKKDGSTFWARSSGKFMCMQNDEPICYNFISDITADQSVYEEIINTNAAGVLMVDKETWEIIYANDFVRSVIQCKGEKSHAQKCYKYLWDLDEPCKDCYINQLHEEDNFSVYRNLSGLHRSFIGKPKIMNWFGRDVVVIFISEVTESEKNRLIAEQRERLLRQAIEDANLLSWEYDLRENRLVRGNHNLLAAGLLQNPNDLPESQIADGYIAKESIEDYRKFYEKIRGGETSRTQEVWMYRDKDVNDKRCFRLSYTVSFDETGAPVSASGLGLDISDTKWQEEMQQNQLDRIMRFNPTSLGIINLNLSKNYVVSQRPLFPFIEVQDNGLTVDTYIKRIRHNFLNEEEYQAYFSYFSRDGLLSSFERGKQRVSLTHQYRFGQESPRWLTTSAFIFQNQRTKDIETILSASDSSEKVLTTEITEHFIDKEYDIVALIYPKRGFVDFRVVNHEDEEFNKSGIDITDYEQNREWAAKRLFEGGLSDKYYEDTNLETIIYALEKYGRYSFTIFRFIDGKRRHKCYSYSYLSGNKDIVLCTVQDVTNIYEKEETQLLMIQQALDEAKKANAAKTTFLSNMSHDIRTPMNAIINIADLAQEDMDDREALLEDLKKIKTSGSYLLELLNEILDMSKIENDEFRLRLSVYRYDDFLEYIHSVIDPMCKEKNISFSCWDNCGEYAVFVDRSRLNQMIINLLGNAVKYTEHGGHISFTTMKNLVKDGMVFCRFIVEDDGIGMSKEFQKRMFEPFEREETTLNTVNGTGLGLPIVKKIVESMGGHIAVDSVKGHGTTFTITLCLKLATDEQIKNNEKKEKMTDVRPNFKGKRILIADDHELNREIIKRLLSNTQAFVETVEDGKQCLNAFCQSTPGYYSGIIMDIRMPEMDGYEATRHIRALTHPDAKSIPIIAMTANAFPEDREDAIASGMTDYLAKPVNRNDLFDLLNRHIG